MDNQHCHFCGAELRHTFADLGLSPLANEYLSESELNKGQIFFPLKVNTCEKCFLTQAALFERPESIFGEYKYFSSFSQSWLKHCKSYVEMIIPELGLNTESKVLEIACNDGYLLQYFIPYNIRTKGIEPAENVAKAAREKGIDVECCFFNSKTAERLLEADSLYELVIGNNVLAHVPDIADFVKGLFVILAHNGTITMEFPHLLQLIQNCQFDTIYHEHFHYLSLLTVQKIFNSNDLEIYKVEELKTHGGSLRIYAAHKEFALKHMDKSVDELLKKETDFGLKNLQTYTDFSQKIREIKFNTVKTFAKIKQNGKKIAAFGAAAKGNTFLNFCGIKTDMIDFVVDSNPHKQGLYLPGSLIPITDIDALRKNQPDYLVIFPWNLKNEIMEEAGFIREWGGKFITCIPNMNIE